MPEIFFTVPAVPVAQPRQRHRVVMAGGRTFAQNYTPRTGAVQDFKATVRLAAERAYSGPPLQGPLALTLVFVLPRPKSMIWRTRPMPRVPHTARPDFDNLSKAATDALNGRLFADDSQLFQVITTKWIAAGDEQPHVEVKLCPMWL